MAKNLNTGLNIISLSGDTNALSVDSNSLIVKDNGFVGIGKTAPLSRLHVQTANFLFNGVTDQFKFSNDKGDWFNYKDGGGLTINDFNNGLGSDLGTQDLDTYFLDYNFSSMRTAQNPTGKSYVAFDRNLSNSAPFTKMGINTINTAPWTLLQLNLDKFGANIGAQPIVLDVLDNYGAHNIDLGGTTKVKTGLKSRLTASFTTTTTGTGIVRAGWFNAQGGDKNEALYAENGDVIVENGNVGIGTTAPTERLHVKGSGTGSVKGLRVDDSTSSENFFVRDDGMVSATYGYSINGTLFIHDGLSSLSSTFVGKWAGFKNAAGGLRNVGVGLSSLFDNITGDGNTAIGYQSLTNSTGNSNTAVGSDSATAIVAETGVTAVGERALNNTTGSNNTGIGHLTGSGVVGANNTFLGKYAGWTGIGQTSAVTGSIAIGVNSFTDSSNQMTLGIINEFVFGVPTRNVGTPITIRSTDIATGGLNSSNIGHLTIAGGISTGTGLGADIILQTSPAGVSGTTQNALVTAMIIKGEGNIGIGTSAPSATLDVVGTLQYVDGNESSGYVLTSDASGNATWQAPITGTSKYAENTVYVAAVTKTITHSLGTTDIHAVVYDASGNQIIPDQVGNRTSTTVDITMNTAGTFRTVIIG